MSNCYYRFSFILVNERWSNLVLINYIMHLCILFSMIVYFYDKC